MKLLEELKQYLLEKGYKPGDKIATEYELATHFQVSRGKIREAANTLAQLGILEKKARRGTILKSLDPDSVSDDLRFRFSLVDFNPADFMEAREVIENAILPLALKRMTPTLLNELEQAAEDILKYIQEPEKADQADQRFHLILLEACGNKTLQTFGQVIQTLFRAENRQQYWVEGKIRATANDHIQLVQAIKDSDCKKAQEAMAKHFKH